MATKRKIPEMTTQDLIAKYTDYVLEEGKKPNSVYKFCKDIGIEETDFYKHFASFETLESAFFVALHTHTLSLLQQNEAYSTYDDANKLLSYYFTFFEMATANRSFILMTLKNKANPLDRMLQLNELRKQFSEFADTFLSSRATIPEEKLKKIQGRFLREGAWVQMLLTFKFWLNDSSPNFEKTDIMIEKSVTASFDVLDNFPLKSVVDLGKFLWKERSFQ